MHGAKECIILERINKFTVQVILNGVTRSAYLNNTGRLSDYISHGKRGFCIEHQRKMKTACRLFAVRDGNQAALLDTQIQMKTLEKIIASNLIPWIRGYRILRRNAKLDSSRIDYLLEYNGEEAYLEVKSAVLRNGKYAMYPDCLSLRGRRHIMRLTKHAKEGGRGILLFIAALPDVKAFKPNTLADSKIGHLLSEAKEAGVNIRALELYYNPKDSHVYLSNPNLQVEL